MKVQSNYYQLLLLRDDINNQMNASLAFAFFNKTKIKEFFQRNAMRLETANDMLTRLVKKYVKHDDAGEPIKLGEEGKMKKWDFNNEADEKEFGEEYKEFMNRAISIEI